MILWGKEHQLRADALAEILGEKSAEAGNLPRSNDGIQPIKCSDTILTVWGHGNATHFSEMLDVEFGKLIQAWKKMNPSLKSVELITCDAQHNTEPLAGYAKRVAKFVEREYKDIVIKALPVGQHSDDRSILWANSHTKTFCYITGPSPETINHANERLEALSRLNGGDLGIVAAEMAKERKLSTPNNFTVNGSGLKYLRATLAVIKTS